MPRVKIGPAAPDRSMIEVEIAHLRNLDIGGLRSRWHAVFERRAPPHLPRHLLFRILGYRVQANHLGDLDRESSQLLDRSASPDDAGQRAVELAQRTMSLRPGTVPAREWNGQMHRVTVLGDGFAWNGETYSSLTKIAVTITGTRWSGPRFFGVHKPSKAAKP